MIPGGQGAHKGAREGRTGEVDDGKEALCEAL